jgi:penicillin-binding protein 1C
VLAEVEVCSLSGMRPTAACPHRRRELLPRDGADRASGSATGVDAVVLAPCDMHETVRIDPRNGLRAGACSGEVVEERVFERYDARLSAWARAAGRPVAPEQASPLCGALAGVPSDRAADVRRPARLRVAYPPDGARFLLDPSVTSVQAIRLRADVPPGVRHVRFVIDGRPTDVRAPFALDWRLAGGAHRLHVEADGAAASDGVEFWVE